jgi:SAM-dependent methyltransferase
MQSKDETLKAYDAIAPLYEEYSLKKQSYLDSIDILVGCEISSKDRVLDIGAGDGRRLAKIIKNINIKKPVAIEPSTQMANICKSKLDIDVHQIFAENTDQLEIGTFNIVIALWNVFGHIQSTEARLKALNNIYKKLNHGGKLILDINNRHNSTSYGFINVLKRRLLDFFYFDEKRGDAVYDWKILDKTFKSSGHLFTPSEIETLLNKSNFKIVKRLTVNYETGKTSESKFKGQLFYVLEKSV